MQNEAWGRLLSIDLAGCDKNKLTDGKGLSGFCKTLCKEIGMVPVGEAIVKRFGQGEIEGFSAMQFIETSSITIHFDEFGGRAFIDIFGCRLFDKDRAKDFCKRFFEAKKVRFRNFYRR